MALVIYIGQLILIIWGAGQFMEEGEVGQWLKDPQPFHCLGERGSFGGGRGRPVTRRDADHFIGSLIENQWRKER